MYRPRASGMMYSSLLGPPGAAKGDAMESFRIANLTQPFRRHRLSRRAALASAGVSLSATLLGRAGLSPRNALAQDATPAAEAAAGDNLPPSVPAWMRTPGAPSSPYGERAPAEESVRPPRAQPGRQLLAAGRSARARSRPMPSSTRSTSGASRPSTRASTGCSSMAWSSGRRSSRWTTSSASPPSRSSTSWSARAIPSRSGRRPR